MLESEFESLRGYTYVSVSDWLGPALQKPGMGVRISPETQKKKIKKGWI